MWKFRKERNVKKTFVIFLRIDQTEARTTPLENQCEKKNKNPERLLERIEK